MTNDAERSPMSGIQPESSKQYHNKNATRWSDESKNACLKVTSVRYRAFSLPGQFAQWSESANRTLANSLPGTFVPWPFRSQAFSLPGTKVLWNYRSLNVSIAVYFRCRTLAFTPKIKYKIALRKIN